MTDIKKLTEEIHALRQDTKRDISQMAVTLKVAVIAVYSGNILAAKLQSAKTDYERNEIIKEAGKILTDLQKSLEEPCQTEKTS